MSGSKEVLLDGGQGRTNPFAAVRGNKMAMWSFVKFFDNFLKSACTLSHVYACIYVSLDEDRHEEDHFGHNVTCNDACFGRLFDKLASDKLSSHERTDHCNSLHSISGSLMYSMVCRNILSDIPEHRAIADKGGSSYRKSSCNIIDTGWIQHNNDNNLLLFSHL